MDAGNTAAGSPSLVWSAQGRKEAKMKARTSCFFLAIGLVLLSVLIGLTLLGVPFLRQRQALARWENLPPVTRITEPQSGSSAPVGSYLTAVSTITFSPQRPVQLVEWYLNGTLVESHPQKLGVGVSRTYDSIDLLVLTEGTHVLVARAIDAQGTIGQSLPRAFEGVARGEGLLCRERERGRDAGEPRCREWHRRRHASGPQSRAEIPLPLLARP